MLATLYFVGTTLQMPPTAYDSQETSTFVEELMSELAQLATEVYLNKSVYGTANYRNTDAQ
jgi:hypothetical protein